MKPHFKKEEFVPRVFGFKLEQNEEKREEVGVEKEN